MADLFADQYAPPSHYRSGGDEYIPPLPTAPLTAGVEGIVEGAAAAPSRWYAWFTSMNAMLALAFAMGLVALILAVLVWYGTAQVKKDFKCLVCKKMPSLLSDNDKFKTVFNRLCQTVGLIQLGPGWSYVGSSGTIGTTGMLFSVATTPGSPLVVSGLTPGASLVPTLYDGLLKALYVETNGILTTGTATVTVTINGVATALSGTVTAGNPNLAELFEADTPITFEKGDLVGVTISYTGISLLLSTFTTAAQVVVQYVPKSV